MVDTELERMKNFQKFLRTEDQIIFEDMMNQCKLYASYASTLASPIKEVPLIISMLFAHHKMLWEHEKYLASLKTLRITKTNSVTSTDETAAQNAGSRASDQPMATS